MTETRRLKNVVIFIQTILSFVLSRKIIDMMIIFLFLGIWCFQKPEFAFVTPTLKPFMAFSLRTKMTEKH